MFERLLKIFLPVAFGVAFQTSPANALGVSPAADPAANSMVVIAQVQAGASSGDAAATQEFISLYNNSGTAADITDWCVSNKGGVSFACFDTDAGVALSLPPHAYALIASDSFKARYGGTYDAVYATTNRTSGSIVGGSDTLTLLDANSNAIDVAAWTTSLAGGSNVARSWKDQVAGVMLDTNAVSDFKKLTALVVPPSGVTEETHVVDVCGNLDGAQSTLPDGYGFGADGDCVRDACSNMSGLQVDIPAMMKADASNVCLYDLPLVTISELLPNAAGSDDGAEFIELHNANETTVDLTLYRLQVGTNFEKTFAFGAGTVIAPGTYAAFYNTNIGFSLLNTSSRVRLISIDGQVISEPPAYSDPADDEAWAFLGDTWLFTNQPTPGLGNLLPTDDGTTSDANPVMMTGAKPCAANQYRNPETNRCRMIVATAEAKPCRDDQYRSEETNRCRSITAASDTQKPCADNQFRNPDTGRCKKIASEDDVRDCGEGRERNPETNRCRNVVTVASGKTSGGVGIVAAPAATVMGIWAVGTLAAVAVGYGALEWRHEIGGWFGRAGAAVVNRFRRP